MRLIVFVVENSTGKTGLQLTTSIDRSLAVALLGGVSSWNSARKELLSSVQDLQRIDLRGFFEANGEISASDRVILDRIDFSRLDLSGSRMTRCDFNHANFDRSDLSGVDFSGSNLLGASMRGATLNNAAMLGTDIGEANLIGANLQGVRLARGKLAQIKAAYADLSGASLRNADLYRANFRSANLEATDLRGADLRETKLNQANLASCNVRTIPIGSTGTGIRTEITDLSSVIGLTQAQLDTMSGDRRVVLPKGLEYPDHWNDFALPKTGDAPLSSRATVVSGGDVRENMSHNAPGIALSSLALLGLLRQLRDQVLTLNQLAAEHPEERDEIVDFIDSMIGQTYDVLSKLPRHGGAAIDADDAELAGAVSQYFQSAKEGFGRIMDPKKLGAITAPAVTVLTFGTVGFLVSGFNPIGFGAGSLFGRWISQDMKLGEAAERMESIMGSDDNASSSHN